MSEVRKEMGRVVALERERDYWQQETREHYARRRAAERALADARGRLEAAEVVVRELVELKDGPRDADYERRKPLAWAAARAILNSNAP